METQTWDNGPNYSRPVGIPPSSVYGQGGVDTPRLNLSIHQEYNDILIVGLVQC